MDEEPIEYTRDGNWVYGIFENEDGSTREELLGWCDEEDDGPYYDKSGDFGGAG